MVTLTHIPPHPSLAAFVQFYQLLEFDTLNELLLRPWHGTTENHLVFFLEDKPLYLRNELTGYYVEGSHNIGVIGISTRFNGVMKFRGRYRCFLIAFMPDGFFKLFRFSLCGFTDKILAADDLFGNGAKELLEQLQASKNMQEMSVYADRFLDGFLRRRKFIYHSDGIGAVARDILLTNGSNSSKAYAGLANMSLRNFERRFNESVGVSVKLYSRLLRFEKAVKLKSQFPEKEWTIIAYDCGYFDQAHMIRDFKQFAGASPSSFFGSTPPPQVTPVFLERVYR